MRSFNSRTREGATSTSCGCGIPESGFNSRTREGATRCPRREVPLSCFNSRTREGATKALEKAEELCEVSIHAPVRVRLYDVYIVIGLLEFQFTHP